jgi:hypothetical protein
MTVAVLTLTPWAAQQKQSLLMRLPRNQGKYIHVKSYSHMSVKLPGKLISIEIFLSFQITTAGDSDKYVMLILANTT